MTVSMLDEAREKKAHAATERFLETAVAYARSGEMDAWRIADDCFAAVAEKLGVEEDELRDRDPGSKYERPLWQLFEELETEAHARLQAEGVPLPEGKQLTKAALDHDFKTARAWPEGERSPSKATFTAHHRLAALKLDDRAAVLERLIRKEEANAKRAGRAVSFVTGTNVRDWRRDQTPAPPPRSFMEKVEHRVRVSLNGAVSPGWQHVAQDDRDSIARTLRQIANQIENGEFPKTKDGQPCL